jgi:hypothetical protein
MLKHKFIIKLLITSIFLLNCTGVNAGINNGDIEGFYVPRKGWAESQELFPGEVVGQQLGKFKIVLKRQGWRLLSEAEKLRIRKRLVISGVFRGVVDNAFAPPVVAHQFSNHQRDGALISNNDGSAVIGVVPCSEEPGKVVLDVIESINIEKGTGIYHQLHAGGVINLAGSVNFCTLQNDFEIIEGVGGLCFGGEACD